MAQNAPKGLIQPTLQSEKKYSGVRKSRKFLIFSSLNASLLFSDQF